MKKTPILALLVVLPYAIGTYGATAQTADTSQKSSAGYVGWDAKNTKSPEIMVAGIVQRVDAAGTTDCRVGLCALMEMPQGPVEILLGPYRSQTLQQVIVPGRSMQVSGRLQNIQGQNVLLASQLVVDGQQITIRNDHGFLVHPRTTARVHTQTLQNGEKQ